MEHTLHVQRTLCVSLYLSPSHAGVPSETVRLTASFHLTAEEEHCLLCLSGAGAARTGQQFQGCEYYLQIMSQCMPAGPHLQFLLLYFT